MTDIAKWFDDSDRHPLVIAGPCSAESFEQLLATAQPLSQMPEVSLFRAGIWKPRTRPGGFEGRGEEALAWLNEINRTLNMPTIVEVATPSHVEQCLKYGINAVWIGARTVVNPFSVEQLADALKGTRLPVFIKNPVTPDLKLWLGAFERLQKDGLTHIAAIHRGFHHYADKPYRNHPMWEMAMEMTRLTGIPMITDVSHICGRRDIIPDIAQKALDMATDGLMIEVHHSPDDALTDAQQQIAPDEFASLMSQLIWRSKSSVDDKTLVGLRAEIDDIDTEMLRLLARRMDVSRSIGALKKQNGLTAFQPDRWKQTLADRLALGNSLELGEELVTRMFEAIHKASVDAQTDILGKEN